MGWIKEGKAESLASAAKRAAEEKHTVFVAQFRGAISHSPALSRPVQDVAEMIEAVEAHGWRMDNMDSFTWNNNITVLCLFRRQDS